MDYTNYLFVCLLCLGCSVFNTVLSDSVNKDKGGGAPVTTKNSDVVAVIPEHLDLPTKFGDEDDIIKLKQPSSDIAAIPSAAGKTNAQKNDGKKQENSKFDHINFESEEEHYDDEDEEDFILSEHFPDKDDPDDSEYKNGDYDESELGPTLDNFGTKLDGGDSGDELPIFLSEPQSTYVIRSRPAILKCKAAHALQVINFVVWLLFLFFYCYNIAISWIIYRF